MKYSEIVKKIKNLEIQGAERIAIAATEALAQVMNETKDPKKIKKAHDELISLRATEPALRNSLAYCLSNFHANKNTNKKSKTSESPAVQVKKHFEESQKRIAIFGAKKILNGMNVFTHCHSSTVEGILIEAKKQGKKFTVVNTETRPRYQGRVTATNLAKAGIHVIHMVDSAGRTAMKKADIFLFGCDSLSAEGKIINKIGTEFLAEFAHQARIPAYCCTNSWKFNPETIEGLDETIELRSGDEVWPDHPKNVTIFNPAFEIISPDIITGVITEIGIFKPENIVNQIQVKYPWLINSA